MNDRPPASVAGVAARVLPSVVMIKVNGGEGTGSGFIIRGGYIVTDNHVVTLDGQVSTPSLQVVFNGGMQASARLVGRDPYSDIAVIKPSGQRRLPALTLGNSDSVEVGDPVIADRLAARPGRDGDQRHRQRAGPARCSRAPASGHDAAGVLRRDPDRRADQPRQLRRPAGQRARARSSASTPPSTRSAQTR